jgi:tetratricopeptide (TPR) repeat protein
MSTESLAQLFKITTPKQIDSEHTIVVVDDQQDLRLIVAHHLAKLNFRNASQAGNGMEAIELQRQLTSDKKNVSVTICDWDMPLMNGMDYLIEMRDNPDLERGPFIIAMDNPSKEKVMFAMENGADEILLKPYTLNDIMPKMRSAFKVFHNPNNPEKIYELAKSLFRAEKYDEAEKVYKAIVQHTKRAARPLIGLARIEVKRNNTEAALKLIAEAEERNPAFVHTFALRGEIFAGQQKNEEAILAFRRAIELSPLNPIRYESIAGILFKLQKYEDAVNILNMAETNGLSFPSLSNYLSQGYYALKDYKQATKHIRQALGQDPENVTFMNQLGICYKEQQMFEDATKVYNSIIKIDPDNVAALYNKAILVYTKGESSEAIKLLERALKKQPDFGAARAKLEEYKSNKGGSAA